MSRFPKQWYWGFASVGLIAGLYVIQVGACYVRILVPYKTIESDGIKVVGVYGVSDKQMFVPLLGLMIFSGDGNRLHIYRGNRLIYEAGFDLFVDLDWNDIKINPEQIVVPGLNPEEIKLLR